MLSKFEPKKPPAEFSNNVFKNWHYPFWTLKPNPGLKDPKIQKQKCILKLEIPHWSGLAGTSSFQSLDKFPKHWGSCACHLNYSITKASCVFLWPQWGSQLLSRISRPNVHGVSWVSDMNCQAEKIQSAIV